MEWIQINQILLLPQVVKVTIDFEFMDRGIMQIKNVRIRDDNVTHYVSRIVESFLSSSNLAHEKIHPASLKEDAYIRAFNSILEKEVIRRFELSSFMDAEKTISIFISFYNNGSCTLQSIAEHQERYMKNGKKR